MKSEGNEQLESVDSPLGWLAVPKSPCQKALVGLLLVSFALRCFMVAGGGIFYWPDESLYEVSRAVAKALLAGDLATAFAQLDSAAHFLFKAIGVLPALIEQLCGTGPEIAVILFSLASIVSIWLIWRISLSLGSSEGEALTAAFLVSLSSALFYYSRHLFSYDLSMAFAMASAYYAVQGSKKSDSLICGLYACACFTSYNGYWSMAGFALVVHVLQGFPHYRTMLRRSLISGAGLVGPFLGLVGLSHLLGGDMLNQFVRFSGTITQGEYAEGATLPFKYLWHCEGFLLVIWLVAVGTAVVFLARNCRNKRIAVALGGVVFLYFSLVIFSVVLGKFVVYGRLARQVVPFLCMVLAHELWRLRESGQFGRRLFPWACALIFLQGAWNLRQPLCQEFPLDFARRANLEIMKSGRTDAMILYAEHIPVRIHKTTSNLNLLQPTMPHEVLFSSPHPMQFIPYQFEGFFEEDRMAMRAADIRMRVIIPTK